MAIEQEIKGKLTYVAKTAGIKINDQPTWFNPTPEAKERILPKLEDLKKLIGSQVLLRITETGDFKSIQKITEETQNVDEQKTKKDRESPQVDTQEKTQKVAEEEEVVDIRRPAKKQVQETITEECEPMETTTRTDFEQIQNWDKDYFDKLSKIECQVDKKNGLNYISWADAWKALKTQHPDAKYIVHENKNGMPYFYDSTGAFAKVSVTVCELTYTSFLPVMDNRNNTVKRENMTSFQINKTIQRAFTKAIAMHGIGLYVYQGEDLPEE